MVLNTELQVDEPLGGRQAAKGPLGVPAVNRHFRL